MNHFHDKIPTFDVFVLCAKGNTKVRDRQSEFFATHNLHQGITQTVVAQHHLFRFVKVDFKPQDSLKIEEYDDHFSLIIETPDVQKEDSTCHLSKQVHPQFHCTFCYAHRS